MTRKRKSTTADPSALFGYVRVSTVDQADSGAGLDAQKAAILDAAKARAYEIVAIIEDAASGKDLNRPGIGEAVERIEAGEAGGLMVAKLDRLSRSLLDFANLMERARAHGWRIVALDLGLDTSTPAGELMAAILATFAQYERRMIALRTKEALAAKQAAGMILGRPRTISQELVDRIVAEREAGATLQAIADGLNADRVPTAQGGKEWTPNVVRRIVVREQKLRVRAAKGA